MATHVNAFKQDVADALAEVGKVLQDVKDKYDRLLTKLEQDASEEEAKVAPTPEASVDETPEDKTSKASEPK